MDSIIKRPSVETMPAANMEKLTPRIQGTTLSTLPQERTQGKLTVHDMARQYREKYQTDTNRELYTIDPSLDDYELVEQILKKAPSYRNVIFSDDEAEAITKVGKSGEELVSLLLHDKKRTETRERLFQGADVAFAASKEAFSEWNIPRGVGQFLRGGMSASGAIAAPISQDIVEPVASELMAAAGGITGLGTTGATRRAKKKIEDLRIRGITSGAEWESAVKELESIEPSWAIQKIQPYAKKVADWYDSLPLQDQTTIDSIYHWSNVADLVFAGATAVKVIDGLESALDQAAKQTVRRTVKEGAVRTGKEIAEEITESATKRLEKKAVVETTEGAVEQGAKQLAEEVPFAERQLVKTGTEVVTKADDVERVAKYLGSTAETSVDKPFAFTRAVTGIDVGDEAVFAKVASGQITIETLGQRLGQAMQKQLDDLATTGAGYKAVREGGGNVVIPKDVFDEVFSSVGIKATDKGVVEIAPLSTTLDRLDLKAITTAYNKAMKLSEPTMNQYLNLRKILDNMSGWEAKTSTESKNVLKRMRGALAEAAETRVARSQKGLADLKALDIKFAKQTNELKQLRSEYFTRVPGTKAWRIKDTALSTIAGLNKPGRIAKLQRLETVLPGVSKEIMALRAFEQLSTKGGKILGNFARNVLIAAGVSTGSAPVVLGAFLMNPNGLKALLRVAALVSKKSAERISGIIGKIGKKALSDADTAFINKLLSSDIKIPKDKLAQVSAIMSEAASKIGIKEFIESPSGTAQGTPEKTTQTPESESKQK